METFFPDLTKEEKYVLLHKAVLALSKGKPFTNKDDLDSLVKDIVKKVVDEVIKSLTDQKLNSPIDAVNASPDYGWPGVNGIGGGGNL